MKLGQFEMRSSSLSRSQSYKSEKDKLVLNSNIVHDLSSLCTNLNWNNEQLWNLGQNLLSLCQDLVYRIVGFNSSCDLTFKESSVL